MMDCIHRLRHLDLNLERWRFALAQAEGIEGGLILSITCPQKLFVLSRIRRPQAMVLGSA